MTPEIMTYQDPTRKVVFRLIHGGPDPLYRRTCYELRRRRWRRVRRDREPWSLAAVLLAEPLYYPEILTL